MSEIDQQFIEYVVKSLVGKPDAVHIDRRIDEKGVLLELTVDPEDLGRVIGKRGATAQSLRTLLRALGTKNDARYNLKIIDNSPAGAGRSAKDESAADKSADDAAAAPSDDTKADTPAAETAEAASEPAETESAPEETAPEPAPAETEHPDQEQSRDQDQAADQTSDRLAQTRAELADLDDLDV